jgi:bifunctional NMN adenylyltransferase/nudix hydrolase
MPPVFVQMEIAKSTEWYKSIAEEQQFVEGYKALWAGTPFPVTFNTTDTVVIKSGHLLVVKRKFNPGKGQLALPGGFLESKMTIIDSALKELKEETGIKVNKTILRNSIVDQKTFDAVNRSTRGRTITHGVCINLGATGELPHVKGSDDAERAMWIPVYDIFVREPEFYEDHAHIANFFISRLNK